MSPNHSKASKIIKIVLISKFVLFFLLIISFYFVKNRSDFDYTQFLLFTQKPNDLFNFLLGAWANFDGIHYLGIAGRGYIDEGRFLPLFPILIKIFSFNAAVYSAGQLVTAQIISLISLIIFFNYLNKLVRLDFNSYVIRYTLYVILLFPSSFFLLSIYAESLFLALTVMSFYFARKKQWGRAILFASLSSVTRLSGIVVILAIAYEYLITNKILKLKKFLFFILYSFLSLLPLSLYAYFNYLKWGDPLYFIHAHSLLSNSRSTSNIVNPLQTVFRYLKILATFRFAQYEYWIAMLELGIFFFAISMIYLLWKKKLRTSYLIYALLSLLLPILSGSFSGLPRYILTIFPIFIILSQIKSKRFIIAYYLTSGSLLIILFLLFSRGYFVA